MILHMFFWFFHIYFLYFLLLAFSKTDISLKIDFDLYL